MSEQLPYTYTDEDNVALRVGRGVCTAYDRPGQMSVGFCTPKGEEAVRVARAILAAAGDTGHMVVSREDSARAIRIRESIAAESMRDRAEGVARRVNVGGGVAALIHALPLIPDEDRYCGATIDRPDGTTYTCTHHVGHEGGCSPDSDTPNAQDAQLPDAAEPAHHDPAACTDLRCLDCRVSQLESLAADQATLTEAHSQDISQAQAAIRGLGEALIKHTQDTVIDLETEQAEALDKGMKDALRALRKGRQYTADGDH